jgi:hypothetical protein
VGARVERARDLQGFLRRRLHIHGADLVEGRQGPVGDGPAARRRPPARSARDLSSDGRTLRPIFPTFRLTFMLPPVLGLIAPGLHKPAPDGCQLRIDRGAPVHCTGPSRRAVFEHAAKFLRQVGKDRGAIAFTAVVDSPPGYWAGSSGRDFWSITVGAEVSFAPTGLGAEVFACDGSLK